MSIASLLNKNIVMDKSKYGSYDESVKKITRFINNFIGKYRLTVNTIQKNTSNGSIQFDTTQIDPILGNCRQYINIILNKDFKLSIDDLDNTVGNFSKDYKSLFSYFSLFGYSNIYSRCTCKNYLSKYSTKRGMQNYMCSHILYSMSLFPYYLTYVLQ
jgi:hypothetical protein